MLPILILRLPTTAFGSIVSAIFAMFLSLSYLRFSFAASIFTCLVRRKPTRLKVAFQSQISKFTGVGKGIKRDF